MLLQQTLQQNIALKINEKTEVFQRSQRDSYSYQRWNAAEHDEVAFCIFNSIILAGKELILVKGGNSFTTVDLNSYIKLQCSQGFFWLRNRLWNSMSDTTLFIYRVFKFHFPSTMEHTQAIVSCSEFTTHLHLVFHLKSSHKTGFEFTHSHNILAHSHLCDISSFLLRIIQQNPLAAFTVILQSGVSLFWCFLNER